MYYRVSKSAIQKLLFFALCGAGIFCLFFFVSMRSYAATCDKVTWNTPIEKDTTAHIFTLSGTVANCSGNRHLRLQLQFVRTQADQSPIDNLVRLTTNSGGTFSTDVPFLYTSSWRLILYDEDATDAIILTDNGQKFSTISVTPGGSSSPQATPDPNAAPAPQIACNTTFSYDGDQDLLSCPQSCPNLIPLQGNNYQCSTQGLTNLPLETTDVKIVLRPKSDVKDTYIVNQAFATYLNSSASVGTSTSAGNTDLPPNDNTCSGHYDFTKWPNLSQLKNFGDPACTIDEAKERDALYAMLRQLDPTYADDWFNTIIPCETGGTYSPNSYNGSSPAQGAYGLFQMGGSGKNGTVATTNGNQYDIGDVVWQKQVENAISYNKSLMQTGRDFQYWECAEYLW